MSSSSFGSESQLVNLYVTTYGNEAVFEQCLDSYLRQTHANVKIHIFDDGLADGMESIRELVTRKNDARIHYRANAMRFGLTNNDAQVLRHIDSGSRAMLLAADQALADNAVEMLLDRALTQSAQVVRANGQSHEYSRVIAGGSYDWASPTRETALWPTEETVNSMDVVAKYFGAENIHGEYNAGVMWGSLFDGGLVSNFGDGYRRFHVHGFEQYLALLLLVGASRVSFIAEPLNHDIVNQPRLGGSFRPVDDSSRMECLLACDDFLQRYDFVLHHRGLDLNDLRRGQIVKAKAFLDTFRGFDGYARDVILRNEILLTHRLLETSARGTAEPVKSSE